MKRLFITIAIIATTLAAMAAGRDTYTIIISLDGLRWDYPEAFDAPFFDRMARDGVKAVMSPSFPSKTFPNHYTLATGLRPDHHGIIANKFMVRDNGKVFSLSNREMRTDGRYFGGEPVWITAQRQGVTCATVYWVGSDVAIQGQHPTYWQDYLGEKLTHAQRVDEVLRLLQLPEAERPHLVMCYFEEPDASGHACGPIVKQTRQAFERMDSLLAGMWQRLQTLDIAPQINFIVTGDHGMAWVDNVRVIRPSQVLNPEWTTLIAGDLPTNIYVKSPECVDSVMNALSRVDHIRAWRKADIPAYLGYGSNPNVGDVFVMPDVGWLVTDGEVEDNGSHGFDHTASDMQVAFRAIGPDFKRGYFKPDRFPNVDIYPLLCYLLGVKPAPNDGYLTDLHDILVY